MPYTPDHEPCSNCSDVDWHLDDNSKQIFIMECVAACEGSGGHSTPVFYWEFVNQTNCRPKLQCSINNIYERFKCNCKFTCPKKGII